MMDSRPIQQKQIQQQSQTQSQPSLSTNDRNEKKTKKRTNRFLFLLRYFIVTAIIFSTVITTIFSIHFVGKEEKTTTTTTTTNENDQSTTTTTTITKIQSIDTFSTTKATSSMGGIPTLKEFQEKSQSNVNDNAAAATDTNSDLFYESQFVYANRTYTYRYSANLPFRYNNNNSNNKKYANNQFKSYHNNNNTTNASSSFLPNIVFGVCANSQKPIRRRMIRKSWAQDDQATLVLFVVAGNWDDKISKEFVHYRDLLWVNVSESYREGLTPKTLAFVHFGGTQLVTTTTTTRIMSTTTSTISTQSSRSSLPKNTPNIDYIFKTDDDVYVNATHIAMELAATARLDPTLVNDNNDNNNNYRTADYYGMEKIGEAPIRDDTNHQLAKWYMSREEYPDDVFPPYAPGVGYALSLSFVSCAAQQISPIIPSSLPQSTRMFLRPMPWEDVSVGMLAKRCNVTLTPSDANWPHFSLIPNSNSALDFFPFEKYQHGGTLVTILHKVQPWYFVPLYHQESLENAKEYVLQKKKDTRQRRRKQPPQQHQEQSPQNRQEDEEEEDDKGE